jgi:hypothetical protein
MADADTLKHHTVGDSASAEGSRCLSGLHERGHSKRRTVVNIGVGPALDIRGRVRLWDDEEKQKWGSNSLSAGGKLKAPLEHSRGHAKATDWVVKADWTDIYRRRFHCERHVEGKADEYFVQLPDDVRRMTVDVRISEGDRVLVPFYRAYKDGDFDGQRGTVKDVDTSVAPLQYHIIMDSGDNEILVGEWLRPGA